MEFKIPAVNADNSVSSYGSVTCPVKINQNTASFKSNSTEQTEENDSLKREAYSYSVRSSILPINYISKYVNREVIQNAINTNPEITRILNENGLEPKISEVNIGSGHRKHLVTSYLFAMDIADRMHLDNETKIKLGKAALLHDIGKALIPEEIIQKPGELTAEERRIINLHTDLSAEILKTTDVDPEIISAIDLHHTPAEYKSENLIAQILSVADVFSALKEERPYKPAMSDAKAFELMTSMPELSQNIVRCLQVSRLAYA